jgi:hypothetical protein
MNDALPQDTRGFHQSMVQVRVGNRIFDAIHEPRCNTCTHPARQLIEAEILKNNSYRAIARLYSGTLIEGAAGKPEQLPEITYASIRNHFTNGHMPVGPATLRRLAEERARDIGSKYEEAAEQFVDHHILATAVVHRTYERLVLGEIEPEVKDGIAAAKFLADVEASTPGGIDAEAWSQAMTVYFETAQQVMPPEMWDEFSGRLAVNPILKALVERSAPDPDVIDGEFTAIEQGAT